jgi:uncharacterized DUF497 family protein
MKFEWDDAKAAANLKKHGVSFEEAATAFRDPEAVTLYDVLHSGDEDRYQLIGISSRGRVLTAVFLERGVAIRIIGARRATRQEGQRYGSSH